MHVNNRRTPRSSRPASPDPSLDSVVRDIKNADSRRQRSMSVDNSYKDEGSDMAERIKHTRDFKKKGFKANSRGHSIQAPFTTLEEMFEKLPETCGFNIEMSTFPFLLFSQHARCSKLTQLTLQTEYPMLHESEEQGMDTYAVELNSFTDTVLQTVYSHPLTRPIIFSSFNPDICLLLSFKQPSIPILFLTDAGTCPVSDIRASSLQEAIRFASRWNLLGVVSAAEPLVLCPRLVKVIKESGLVCVSYGTMNNDSEKVNLQVREGIDAVIVDNVLRIGKGLRGEETKSTSPTTMVDKISIADGTEDETVTVPTLG